MQCPSCKVSSFSPVKLEPSLGASECRECSGVVLDLVAYRLWRERHLHESEIEAEATAEPESGTQALRCARCDRISLRFRYTKGTSHVLDVCNHCDSVLLQKGEWSFLKQHRLHGQITQIFTDPWQRSLWAERTKEALAQKWDGQLGPDLHREVKEIREWLRAQHC